MTWGAVAIAGATLVGGAISSRGARNASNAQTRGADAATNEQARQYDQTRTDLAPGRSLYGGATNELSRLFGFAAPGTRGEFDADAYLRDNPDVAASDWFRPDPEAHYLQYGRNEGRAGQYRGGTEARAAGAPDLSGFMASPDYNFRRTEGTRGIERSAAARGGAFSGNALRALTEFNSNLASGEFGSHFNRLTTAAGLGSAVTGDTVAAGTNYANNASRNALYAGDARASGIQNRGNIISDSLTDIAYGWDGRRRRNNDAGGG